MADTAESRQKEFPPRTPLRASGKNTTTCNDETPKRTCTRSPDDSLGVGNIDSKENFGWTPRCKRTPYLQRKLRRMQEAEPKVPLESYMDVKHVPKLTREKNKALLEAALDEKVEDLWQLVLFQLSHEERRIRDPPPAAMPVWWGPIPEKAVDREDEIVETVLMTLINNVSSPEKDIQERNAALNRCMFSSSKHRSMPHAKHAKQEPDLPGPGARIQRQQTQPQSRGGVLNSIHTFNSYTTSSLADVLGPAPRKSQLELMRERASEFTRPVAKAGGAASMGEDTFAGESLGDVLVPRKPSALEVAHDLAKNRAVARKKPTRPPWTTSANPAHEGSLEEVMAKRKPTRLELDKAAALAETVAVESAKTNPDGCGPDAQPGASASSSGHLQPEQMLNNRRVEHEPLVLRQRPSRWEVDKAKAALEPRTIITMQAKKSLAASAHCSAWGTASSIEDMSGAPRKSRLQQEKEATSARAAAAAAKSRMTDAPK